MTTAQREVREIRKQLVESSADPFEVAAMALEQAERYRRLLDEKTVCSRCNVPASTGSGNLRLLPRRLPQPA